MMLMNFDSTGHGHDPDATWSGDVSQPFKVLLVDPDHNLCAVVKRRLSRVIDNVRVRQVHDMAEAEKVLGQESGWMPLMGEEGVRRFVEAMLIGHSTERKQIIEELATIRGTIDAHNTEAKARVNALRRRMRSVSKKITSLQEVAQKSDRRQLRTEIILTVVAGVLIAIGIALAKGFADRIWGTPAVPQRGSELDVREMDPADAHGLDVGHVTPGGVGDGF